jgi:hypothetical protein
MKTYFVHSAAALLAMAAAAQAQSTINATRAYCYSANTGWINCRPSAADGVIARDYHLLGKAYAANTGWINLGAGATHQYANTSAANYGVNHDGLGNLSGYAYSANTGWINFGWAAPADINRPRLNLFTGGFSGYAYSGNLGWINLGTGDLKTDSINRPDSDSDGIGDQWEYAYAGNLTTLSANNDQDKDGRTDQQEYLADTSPFAPPVEASLRFLSFTKSGGNGAAELRWPSQGNRQYDVEQSATMLSGAWAVSSGSGNIAGTGLPITRFIINPYAGGKLFYRVKAKLPVIP